MKGLRFYKKKTSNTKAHTKEKKSSSKEAKQHTSFFSKKISGIGIFCIPHYTVSLKFLLQFLLLFFISATVLFLYVILSYLSQIKEGQIAVFARDDISDVQYPFLEEIKPLSVSSRAFVVYERKSRVVVLDKNETLRFSPASTVKIMTALVVLETYSPEVYLKVKNIKQVEGSKMGLIEGEEIRVLDLLYGLMLPSGNDAAYVLAYNYPGGEAAFIKRMNEKAEALKLMSTHFADSSGYNDSNYSTAKDLARLAAHALENPVLRNIVNTQSTVVYNKSYTLSHKLSNLNELLGRDGIQGVKTGFTEEAGGVLVTAFVKDGKEFILVVLKSEDRFLDTLTLLSNVVQNVQLISY